MYPLGICYKKEPLEIGNSFFRPCVYPTTPPQKKYYWSLVKLESVPNGTASRDAIG